MKNNSTLLIESRTQTQLGQRLLKLLSMSACILLMAGCRSNSQNAFVQDGIEIVPPVHLEDLHPGRTTLRVMDDGGSETFLIGDSKGKTFRIWIDHRLDIKTPGAIYLND